MDYEQRLRLLALNDPSLVEEHPGGLGAGPPVLDAKTVALVRLAALVGVGGAVPSYSAFADAAIDRGATVAEIVDVLVEVIPWSAFPERWRRHRSSLWRSATTRTRRSRRDLGRDRR